MGKGSRDRTKDRKAFDKNFDAIDWGARKRAKEEQADDESLTEKGRDGKDKTQA
ncbi:MAG: hypothetical protein ACPGSC_13045 [Granulosicoccaceae bacterium]